MLFKKYHILSIFFNKNIYSDALFHRDTKASIIYVLLYNNLSTESKDPKDILWAGGVAGKKITKNFSQNHNFMFFMY